VNEVKDNYTLLHGKRLNCTYSGNKQSILFKEYQFKTDGNNFSVSNDGAAFRYYFQEKTDSPVKIFREVTSSILIFRQKHFCSLVPIHEPGGVSVSRLTKNTTKRKFLLVQFALSSGMGDCLRFLILEILVSITETAV
jgi:hypothetical protein